MKPAPPVTKTRIRSPNSTLAQGRSEALTQVTDPTYRDRLIAGQDVSRCVSRAPWVPLGDQMRKPRTKRTTAATAASETPIPRGSTDTARANAAPKVPTAQKTRVV